MSLDLMISAILLVAVSGLPGLFLAPSSIWGQRVAVGMTVGGALIGLGGGGVFLTGIGSAVRIFSWTEPVVGIDALSAFFLIPIFLMGGLGAIYGLGYWSQDQHPDNGRKLQVFWGLLIAGMGLLVISRHGMVFLLGWEMMALAAFFLVCTEDHLLECRWAGWIYLIATHISTLMLFAMFALWRWATGSYILQPVAIAGIDLGLMNGLFFMALIGFGLKAGMMPLHFWLPTAHANAPSHVSAILSGVVIKMGIYGLLRWLMLFPEPPAAWGGLLLVLGAISGLVGVVFAIGQHDLKRLLAYHSVENIGIILMGLGLAMLGRSENRIEWVVLGLAGCLLHVWNHGLFKSLLFLCAGSVVHSTHTREIDQLGGLAKTMPWTAALFLIGAVAICGLPPLNGFVSELFVYLGLFQTMSMGGSAAVLIVPILAAIGALALACFVKVYGAVFLGSPRTSVSAHEAPFVMKGPMIILAVCCLVIGLTPVLVGPILDAVIANWISASGLNVVSVDSLAPLGNIGTMSIVLFALVIVLGVVLKHRIIPRVGTWDCGYAMPTNRMQYSASSFAQMLVALFHWVLHPGMHRPAIHGLFPKPARMHSHVDDAVLDRLLVPTGQFIAQKLTWFYRFQQGLTQHYVLYILITVIVMLSIQMPIYAFFAQFFAR